MARGQIPFENCDGAEGGTRTPRNPLFTQKRPLFARDLQSVRLPVKFPRPVGLKPGVTEGNLVPFFPSGGFLRTVSGDNIFMRLT